MGGLRDRWLDALATCVTAVLLGVLYLVLAGYAAGAPLDLQQGAARHDVGQARQAANPTFR